MDAATAAKQWTAKQGRRGRCASFVWRIMLAGLLALVAVSGAQAANEQAAPYRYELGAEMTVAELATLLPPGTTVRSARVLAPGQSRALAQVGLAETAQGPVLLDWQALVDDPFLTLLPPLAETTALAPVLARHVPGNATVLAWWDLSRQIRLLTDAGVVFSEPLGEPLFVPARWREQADTVAGVERAFWQMPDADVLRAERERFDVFVAALLAPEQEGVAALRALGRGGPVVLVLHLRDLILLGQMAPQKLGVAFRDFGTPGEVHGMIQRVRAWMSENGYAAYGLLQDEARLLRAIALTDEASSRTLAARLLPLVGNDQSDVAGAKLVYRSGGYIVFEIAANPAVASNTAKIQTSQ